MFEIRGGGAGSRAEGALDNALQPPLLTPGVKHLAAHREVQYGGPDLQRLRARRFVETKLHLSYLCVDTDAPNHFCS